MIDADDVGTVALLGSIPLLIIVVIWYLVFSVPEINKCHEAGGVIVRVEGDDICVKKDVLTLVEVKK